MKIWKNKKLDSDKKEKILVIMLIFTIIIGLIIYMLSPYTVYVSLVPNNIMKNSEDINSRSIYKEDTESYEEAKTLYVTSGERGKYYTMEEVITAENLIAQEMVPTNFSQTTHSLVKILENSNLDLPEYFNLRAGLSYRDKNNRLLFSFEVYTFHDDGTEESYGWFYLPRGGDRRIYQVYNEMLILVPEVDRDVDILDFVKIGAFTIANSHSWDMRVNDMSDITVREENGYIYCTAILKDGSRDYYIYDPQMCVFYTTRTGFLENISAPVYSFVYDKYTTDM